MICESGLSTRLAKYHHTNHRLMITAMTIRTMIAVFMIEVGNKIRDLALRSSFVA